MTSITPEYDHLPPELAKHLQLQWQNYIEACEEQQVSLPTHSDFLMSLVKVWCASDFVSTTCIINPEILTHLFSSGDILREYPVDEMHQRMQLALFGVEDEKSLMMALRKFRRREMLRIAWRDLSGWANLNFTSKDLSALADACIRGALGYLSQWLIKEYGQPLDLWGDKADMLVIALGKLGANELNFSSDIDLMFAFPADGEFEQTSKTYQQYFIRLGQKLMQVLSAFTADGFVFRVDMRLRPYGSRGALAVSFAQLREYYQTQGRDWERYALIKARVISGNEKHKRQLKSIIQKFVYRQYLDYSMKESLRQLQQKISQEVRRQDLDNNVKRGPGGIREIEFIGQTYKLIRGGWQPRLQLSHTVRTILVLREMRYLTAELADKLLLTYRFMRRVENYLQMQQDQQTHSLPTTTFARLQLIFALGFETWADFEKDLRAKMKFVHQIFEALIARPDLAFSDHAVQALISPMTKVWLGSFKPEKALAFLTKCHYANPENSLHLLQHLRQSPASKNLLAELRQRLNVVVPYVLVLVSQKQKPDEVLLRVINVFEAVLSHPVYLALLAENPGAMAQLVNLCAVSPWIAEQISRFPALLDELLRPETLYAPPSLKDLKDLLQQQLISIPEDDLDAQMHALQVFKQIHMLRVAAADITGVLSLMKVSDYLTDLATVVVDQVLSLVWHNMVLLYGYPAEKKSEMGFAIVAYGKLGGIELGYSSDLDLVFLRDDVPAEASTDGVEKISSQQFYTRMGQQLLTLLSGQTPAGRLYEIDMRLRPSGDSGLLVSSMTAFETYQQQQAWPWEHQALVRARVVAGDKRLAKQFDEIRQTVLSKQRQQLDLQIEVKQMRKRMRDAIREFQPKTFDLKQGMGGIADIEFLVQYAVLYWSREYPALMEWTDNIRILENMGIAGLIHVSEVQELQQAYRNFRNVVHQLSLQKQQASVPDTDFLLERENVTKIFQRLIG